MNANWEQFKTIAWLRWRLTTNQWRRSRGLGPAIAIISAVAALMIAALAGLGGIAGGAFGLAQVRPEVVLMVWDVVVAVFLFIWVVSLVAELQRSEIIDLSRLLHLPVSLNGIFVMNYLTSLLSIAVAVFLPGSLGLSLGLLWSHGWRMLFLFPLVLSFLFMISAWTYCLRGWLVALMVNPRRRRNVIVGMTMGLVLAGQLPNLLINGFMHIGRHAASRVPGTAKAVSSLAPYLQAHAYVPLLWLSNGAMALAANHLWPAIWGALGAFLLGAAGLARAYRSTMRFYQGSELAGAARPVPAPRASGPLRPNFLEREVPFVPAEVGVLALAFFRSLARAPEAKMAFLANGIVILVVGVMMLSHQVPLPAAGSTIQLFIATGGAVFSLFGPLQIMCNQFGFDREGFRSLVLLPVSRRRLLLGKNLALAPVVLGLGLVLLAVMTLLVHLPVLAILAAFLQMVALYLLLSVVGNFVSTIAPYRMAAGTLKPSKPPPKTVVMIFLTHLLFPVMMLPAFIPPLLALGFSQWTGWPAAPVDVAASLVILGIAALFYSACLNPLGGFLERRERDILLVVSQEVE